MATAEAAEHEVAPGLLHGLQRELLGSTADALARHVAEKVDPPVVAVELVEHRADLLRFGHIAARRDRASPQRADLLRGRLHALLVEVDEQEVRPGLGQCHRHGPAHAAGRA